MLSAYSATFIQFLHVQKLEPKYSSNQSYSLCLSRYQVGEQLNFGPESEHFHETISRFQS